MNNLDIGLKNVKVLLCARSVSQTTTRYVPFSDTNESDCSQKTSTSSLYTGAAKAPSPVAFQSTLSSASKSREDQGKRSSTEREKLRQKESTRERERTSQSTREKERAKE